MFDDISAIIAYEQGDLSDEQTIELFQTLVDNGMAWSLQGHYGRTAHALINAGLVKPGAPEPRFDRERFLRAAGVE